MKVGIYAVDLLPKQAGGIETYLRDLINLLPSHAPQHEFIVITSRNNHSSLRAMGLRQNLRYKQLQELPDSRVARKLMSLKQHVLRRRQIEKLNCDVLHFPLQVIPSWLQGTKLPKVLSIMDLQHLELPEFFSSIERESRRAVFPSSFHASAQVITISDYTKASVIKNYQGDPNKIHTIHLTYRESLFETAVLPVPEGVRTFTGQYLYYPAATWPHKNHLGLLKAFAQVTVSHPQIHLVFSGISKGKSQAINDAIRDYDLENKVHLLSYLDDTELPAIYSNALGMVFPSLFEGFGIPILEAMAVGCPVLCSNVTSIPEVAGSAALYFDPTDPTAIANAITSFVTNQSLRTDLRLRGFDQVKTFGSGTFASKTLEIYDKAFDQN